MKKGEIYEGQVERVDFPNRGVVAVDGEENSARVKNVLPGQRVRFAVNRVRHGSVEGRLLEVVQRAPEEMDPPACPHAGICGGCAYQTLPYEAQLPVKSAQVRDLLRDVVPDVEECWEGIRPSPRPTAYRNKMEFTFGDEEKGGPLTVGMHRRGSRYDIVPVPSCRIVDADFRAILAATQAYFRAAGTPYYHRMRHEGYLRHLLVRKAERTGEILVDLVTSTQAPAGEEALLAGWRSCVETLRLDGRLAGILHTHNDSLGDVILDEGTDILAGQDFFDEEILGLRFRITPFSFFQTNSLGAEVLYMTAREMIADALDRGQTVFDLYSGTGTIAQILAPAADRVIGVEIVPEAVEAARANAAANGLANCEFLAGDVLTVLDAIPERPDLIVLDPPRDGVHPRALPKIIAYGVDQILYISCKPTSLARDLRVLTGSGYRVRRLCCVDMFPGTVQTETVCLLRR